MSILTRIITAEVAGEYLASVHGGHDPAACLYGVGALLGGKRAGVALVSDEGVVTRLCAQTVAVGEHLLEQAWAEARSRGLPQLRIDLVAGAVCAHETTTPESEGDSRASADERGVSSAAGREIPDAATMPPTDGQANYRETLGAAKAFAPKTRWGKLEVVGPVVWRQRRAHVVVKCHCPVGEPFEAACRDLFERRVVSCGRCVGRPGERPDGSLLPFVLVRTKRHDEPGVIAGYESEQAAALERERLLRNPGCESWVIEIKPNEQIAAPKRQRKAK